MDTDKIKKFFFRVYEKAFDEDIFSSSAQVGFYFMFALFPLLVLLVSIFGIVLGQNNEVRAEMFNYLARVMPASAYELVFKTMNEVVEGSSRSKITFGLIATLYSASAGVDSLRIALNDVYKLRETRTFWKRKLLSIAITLGMGLMIFFALGIIFYGSQFLNVILGKVGLPISSPLLLQSLSILVVLALLIATFDLLFYFVPDHDKLTWKWITPGAIVAIALWLLLSKCFSLYLHYFDTYAKTYGSLGAMIILMLWLYLTALVILIGGAMNAVLDEFSRGQYVKLDIYKDQLSESEKAELEEKNFNVSNSQPKADRQGESNVEALDEDEDVDAETETETPPKKTAAKVITGAIMASAIKIFSLRNKDK
ncbi:MAG: YihY/virulence factor BrkB family protein [Pyrinomonadaceae bacterium]